MPGGSALKSKKLPQPSPLDKPSKIQPMSSVVEPHKVLLYGDSRVGKTCLAATAPKPLLFVDAEHGWKSIPTGERDGVGLWSVTTWDEVQEVVEYLYGQAASDGYRSVVFDSLTEIGDLLIEHILASPGVGGRPSPNTMSQADWGTYATEMLKFLREVRDVPDLHVVLIALAQDVDVEIKGRLTLLRRPMIGGKKAPLHAPALFDLVGYVELVEREGGEIVQEVQVRSVDGIVAGARVPGKDFLPPILENPRLDDLFELIDKGGQ